MSDLFDISLADMIKEAEREVAMRRAVYPRQVAASKMTGDLANRRIATMQKIVDTLKGHASC